MHRPFGRLCPLLRPSPGSVDGEGREADEHTALRVEVFASAAIEENSRQGLDGLPARPLEGPGRLRAPGPPPARPGADCEAASLCGARDPDEGGDGPGGHAGAPRRPQGRGRGRQGDRRGLRGRPRGPRGGRGRPVASEQRAPFATHRICEGPWIHRALRG